LTNKAGLTRLAPRSGGLLIPRKGETPAEGGKKSAKILTELVSLKSAAFFFGRPRRPRLARPRAKACRL